MPPEAGLTLDDVVNLVMVLAGFFAVLWGYSHGRHR